MIVQEGFPTAEESVSSNKEQNLLAKISFRYEKHREPFTDKLLLLLLIL